MRRSGFTGDIWPDEIQELLLQAAFLPGERGHAAWYAVRPRIDVDHLPGELHRLMPQLSKALAARALDDPDLPRLKGVYQFSWYRNTMLFKDSSALLRQLEVAGIPTMLLRGAAVVAGHGGDAGLRAMNDLDLLVPEPDFDRARRVATASGWGPLNQAQPLERKFGTAALRNTHGRIIRLRCQPSPNLSLPHAPWDGLWKRAVPARINDAVTCVPAAADHLVHACVDGARADSGASLRWITDSMALLGDPSAGVDWDVVAAEARRLRVSLLLCEALRYLEGVLDASVPGDGCRLIAAVPTTVRDRVAHRLSLTTTPRIASAAEILGRFTRLTAHLPIAQAAAAAPDLLATVLDVDRRRSIAGAAASKVVRAVTSPTPARASLSQAGMPGGPRDDVARRGPDESRLAAR